MYFGAEGEGLDTNIGAVQWFALMGSAAIMVLGIINLFGVEAIAATAAQTLVR
jgi:NADH-quinone oxidoreductase subunit N